MNNNENKISDIQLNSVVGQSDNQVAAEINGEAVMMSVEQGNYYGLDKIGTRIWLLLEQPKLVSDILKVLLEEYEVDSETCKRELCGFLSQLMNQGLISHKRTDERPLSGLSNSSLQF